MRAHHPGTATCSGSSQNGALPAGGAAPFQSMTVSHLPCGGGPLSILSQSRSRLTRPVITSNSSLNSLMVPSYGSTRRFVSLEPPDGVLHRYPGGVDLVVVLLLLGSQRGGVLLIFCGGSWGWCRAAPWRFPGSLCLPRCGSCPPSGVEASFHGFGPLAKTAWGLSLSSVMSFVEPTALFDIPIITPSVLMQTLVLFGETASSFQSTSCA